MSDNPYNIPPGTPLASLFNLYTRDGEHLVWLFILLTINRSQLAFWQAKLASDSATPDVDPQTLIRDNQRVNLYTGRVNIQETLIPPHIPPYEIFGGSAGTLKASAYYVSQTTSYEDSQRAELDAVIDEFMS